jgi:hypothetical protein
MNTDTNTPAEAAKTQLVVALEWLFQQDDRWRPVPSADGATITLTRCWQDATVDAVAMSPDGTYAVRKDPQELEVARVDGTAALVVSAVCSWPVPSLSRLEGSGRMPALSGLPT